MQMAKSNIVTEDDDDGEDLPHEDAEAATAAPLPPSPRQERPRPHPESPRVERLTLLPGLVVPIAGSEVTGTWRAKLPNGRESGVVCVVEDHPQLGRCLALYPAAHSTRTDSVQYVLFGAVASLEMAK
jgi:hypothetical protein